MNYRSNQCACSVPAVGQEDREDGDGVRCGRVEPEAPVEASGGSLPAGKAGYKSSISTRPRGTHSPHQLSIHRKVETPTRGPVDQSDLEMLALGAP